MAFEVWHLNFYSLKLLTSKYIIYGFPKVKDMLKRIRNFMNDVLNGMQKLMRVSIDTLDAIEN